MNHEDAAADAQRAQPPLRALRAICSPEDRDALLGLIHDEALLRAHHVWTQRDAHGVSLELPRAMHPALERAAQRALSAAHLPHGQLTHLRLRITEPTQGHPPHLDDYELDGLRLVATVLITLQAPQEGGQTRFPLALPEPAELAPEPGDALLWYNTDRRGLAYARGLHEGLPVTRGRKITLGCFIYATPASLPAWLPRAPGPTLTLIVDDPDSELVWQLRRAATARGLTCAILDAHTHDPCALEPLEPGALLYRVGTSHAASVLEQQLIHAQVATLYVDPLWAHLIWDNQALALARQGVPTPRAFYALRADRATLRRQVQALGGLPVILKTPGRSLGVGVMRLESWPALCSVLDLIVATRGESATLMSCIEPATHWRVLVVADRAVASYINSPRPDDFRTWVDEDDPSCFEQQPPQDVVQLSVQACQALGLEFGGVDVLVHASGRAYVLEVNFPCYFGHPWRAAGIDVAGDLLDHLLAKSAALTRAASGA